MHKRVKIRLDLTRLRHCQLTSTPRNHYFNLREAYFITFEPNRSSLKTSLAFNINILSASFLLQKSNAQFYLKTCWITIPVNFKLINIDTDIYILKRKISENPCPLFNYLTALFSFEIVLERNLSRLITKCLPWGLKNIVHALPLQIQGALQNWFRFQNRTNSGTPCGSQVVEGKIAIDKCMCTCRFSLKLGRHSVYEIPGKMARIHKRIPGNPGSSTSTPQGAAEVLLNYLKLN